MSAEDPAVKVRRVSLLDCLLGRKVGVKVWPELLLTEERERLEDSEEEEKPPRHESCRGVSVLLPSLIQIFTRTEARPGQDSCV